MEALPRPAGASNQAGQTLLPAIDDQTYETFGYLYDPPTGIHDIVTPITPGDIDGDVDLADLGLLLSVYETASQPTRAGITKAEIKLSTHDSEPTHT